jgi:hypothetical protein
VPDKKPFTGVSQGGDGTQDTNVIEQINTAIEIIFFIFLIN